MKKLVNIYTDGACSGNQNEENKGGWGAILEFNGKEKELFGGMDNTTNNRMELTALISALKVLKEEGLELKIFSDSSYVINCFKSNWHIKWKQNGWKNSKKEPVENQDLWMELLDLLEKQEPTFYLVKGHVKIPKESDFSKFIEHNGKEFTFADFAKIIEYNNRCDELATRYQRGL